MDELDGLSTVAPALAQFLAVAAVEHMTRAAEETGVPQSTLSRGIARLEADLGVELFVRTGRTIALNRAGRTFARRAGRAAAELAAAVQEIRGETDALRGRVGLGFLATLGAAAVPRLLREFRALHPRVRIDLVQGPHGSLLEQLRSGAVDLALTSPAPDDAGLQVEPLVEEQLMLTVPAGHRFAGRASVALAEAADETFVGFIPASGMRSAFEDAARAAGFRPRLAFEGSDTETVRGLVGAGLGIALVPAANHPLGPDVVEVAVREPATTRTIVLVAIAGRTLPPPAAALRAMVRERGLR